MKTLLLSLVLFVSGCGAMGGQYLCVKASDDGSIVQHIYIIDGGTDLGGLFYRPSGGQVNRTTTQPGN